MNVIETLYLLLKSDSSQLRRDQADVQKSTEQTIQSFKKLESASKPIEAAFVRLAKGALGLATAGLTLQSVISGLADATKYTLDLSYVSDQLGVNIEQLDAWGNAVQRTGGTAAGFQQSLRGIASYFNTNPRIALAVLPQLADTFQRLSRINAFRLGKVLGLDEPTILLLQKGRREVDEILRQQKELGVVNKQNAEIAKAYRNATTDTDHALRTLWSTIAFNFLPVLTKIYSSITPIIEYLTRHKDLVVGAFIAMGAAAAFFAAPLVIAAFPVLRLIALVSALGVAFGIVYDDIKGYFEGIDSITGRVLNKVSNALSILKAGFGFNAGSSDNLLLGQQQLALANSLPLNTQTSTTLFTSQSSERNQSVNTGPITINTQATDAQGLAAGLGKAIREHTRYSNSYFDDGVQR